MVKSVEGVYRNGKVELMEPLDETEGSRVIVTWIQQASPVDLRERGIDDSQGPICVVGSPDLRRIGIALKCPPMMNCRRGDVGLVLFTDSNLRTSKRRPALVGQTDQLGARWLRFSMAELGEEREKQINELVRGHDGRSFKGLREMLGIAGHQVVGAGGVSAFQEAVVGVVILDDGDRPCG